MEFHPAKCQVIRVTRSSYRTTILSNYSLHGHQLDVVSSAKYLGITISDNLSWNTHINQVCSKAGKTLGMLRRNLKISAPRVKEQAYNTLVRPKLEYSATIWDPFTKTNKDRLQRIQRRAARWTLNRYHNTSSVSDMLVILGWPSLELRRTDARVCLMYKLVHCLVAVNVGPYVTPATRPTRRTHPYSFIQIPARTDAYRLSFFPRTVVDWNGLTTEIVTAPSLDAFKSRLSSLRAL